MSKVYKTALYCRLSSDDGNLGDSSSIQTQKLMLENYAKDNNFKVVDTYVDDGYSGLNYDRPSFKRLLNDIEDGRVNMVITKDLSRIGRDYIQTGYYTEIYFPDKNIRYIAINDNVDTKKQDNDIAPFKNILNDMYSKDLSKKIKTAKRQRALKGMFISAQVPYGYIKNPSNNNQLLIDIEVRDVIERIYNLALIGKGTVAIAKILTMEKVMTPSAYKTSKGDTRFARFYSLRGEEWEYNWCSATVNKILKDIVYLGHMENRKYEIKNYKSKKRVRVDQDKHIIVENTHEAIITMNDYDRVQDLISAKRRIRKNESYENLFKSIIFCKICNHRMHFANVQRNRAKGAKVYELLYKCAHHFTRRDVCLKNNSINYYKLKEIVTLEIKSFFKLINSDDLVDKINKQKNSDVTVDKLKIEKVKINNRLNTLIRMTSKVYNDNANNILDETINDSIRCI